MQRITTLVLSLAMVTLTLPATASATDVREENREFVLERGDYDPHRIVDVHRTDGVEQMPAHEALELVLDQAGDQSLAQMVASAEHTNGPLVQLGEIFLYGEGNVNCGETYRIADRPESFQLSPQGAWPDQGPVQSVRNVSSNVWWAWGMTFKDIHQGWGGPLSYNGAIARLCLPNFYGDGFGIIFPLIDGALARGNIPPPGFFEPLPT